MTTLNQHTREEVPQSPYGLVGSDAAILVASSVPEVRHMLEADLQTDKNTLLFASTGYETLQRFQERRPDLVLLDLELPGISSWEVGRHLLGRSRVPIIFLAASHQEDEAIRALQLGAVDYVTKTTTPQVLLARTRAALRRKDAVVPNPSSSMYKDEYLQIDLAAQEVLVGGKHVPLTTIEYNLLAYLLKKAGEICPKDQILKQIWGTGYETCLHYVHLYIGRLRRKIERAPSRPEYLISVYGKGYCFQLSDASAQ